MPMASSRMLSFQLLRKTCHNPIVSRDDPPLNNRCGRSKQWVA
jgi:hypothetical protein